MTILDEASAAVKLLAPILCYGTWSSGSWGNRGKVRAPISTTSVAESKIKTKTVEVQAAPAIVQIQGARKKAQWAFAEAQLELEEGQPALVEIQSTLA